MKKTWPVLLGLLLMAAPAAQAQFTYTTNNGAITITAYTGPGGAVTISNFVTSIGTNAFAQASLSSVAIPESVTTIESNAFGGCFDLTSVTIPNSVTNIGTYAFNDCYDITNVTIGNNVINIGDYAFSECELTNVIIPNSVTSLGDLVFSGCELTSVTIPESVSTIGAAPFAGCPLTAISVDQSNLAYMSVGGVLFNNSQTTLIEYPDSSVAATYLVPRSVRSIGDYAFTESELTNVTIPDGLLSIGEYAFAYSRGLVSAYFEGNAPFDDGTIFNSDDGATVYYLPGTSGWGSIFGGVPAVILNPPVPAGSLQVTINPSAAITAGAQWYADGGISQPSGATVLGLAVGNHTVSFSPVSGWTTPANQTVSVSANSTATAIGTYVSQAPEFTYTTNNGAITITGYIGPVGAVTIPSTINGLPVTSIESYAFYNSSGLTSVTISTNVTSIGDEAFGFCFSLASVTIPTNVTSLGDVVFYGDTGLIAITVSSGNPAYISVGGVLFNQSESTLVEYPAGNTQTSYLIPASVTTIGDYAFDSASFLTSITISTNVAAIGDGAFQATGITSLTIPNGVTTVGADTCQTCYSLTNVMIPNSVTSIGEGAFTFCTTLAGVTIPNSVVNIGQQAFGACYRLTNVTIPSSVTNIGYWAFAYCNSLTNATITNSVTSIADDAFQGCSGLVSAYFEGNAPFDDGTIFNSDDGATVYYLPGTSGWGSIFGGVPAVILNPPVPAGSLQVTINPSAAITAGAQWYADGGISQPSGATVLGLAVGNHTVSFSPVSGWTTPANQTVSVSANSTATAIGTYVSQAPEFTYTTNNGAITITGYIGSGGAVTVPNTIDDLPVTCIGDINGDYYVFENTSVTSLTLGTNVTTIGDFAIAYCYGLTTVTIPNSVTNIGEMAFYACFSLTNVNIPNSVTSIGAGAFGNCGLTSVFIPESVTYIGRAVFTACPLITITVDGQNPDYNSVAGVLLNKDETTLIEYPGGEAGSYSIPDGVTTIGDSAFYYCFNLTGVTVPDSVTVIGDNAFFGCSSLAASIAIPSSVINLGQTVFAGCPVPAIVVDGLNPSYSSLDGVLFNETQTVLIEYPGGKPGSYTIPSNVTSIEDYAFYACDGVTSITIPNSVTSIGAEEFGECFNLASIILPDSVNSIGEQEFYGCSSLTSITIPNSIGSLGDYAFSLCSSLANITIPTSVTTIGDSAFGDCSSLAGAYFQGNAPAGDSTVFSGDTIGTVYYLPATIGWGTTFGGLPTALWTLPQPMILNSSPSLAAQSNGFSFNVSWATNLTVVVEACTNLANPVWQPLQTNTLTNGSFYFSDAQWTNYHGRFYRVVTP